MSKIVVKLDDKTFSTFVPKTLADKRFLELCRIAMLNSCSREEEDLQSQFMEDGDQPETSVSNESTDCADNINNELMYSNEDESPPGQQAIPIVPHAKDMHRFDDKQDSDAEMYKGFLHVVCEGCGRPFSFSAKNPTNSFECRECGHVTKLHDLARMKLVCECGKTWRYHTNAESDLVELNCVACHSPMVGQVDKYGDYWPLRE